MTERTPAQIVADLRAPFPAEQIGKLPKGGGVTLDYVGHADVTDRLLKVDPTWNWEPVAIGPDGLPVFDAAGGLWIRLTVGGVTRLGYGDADGKRGTNQAVKIAIGDALRNAAMRFGVALDLWAKGDREWGPDADDRQDPPRARDLPPDTMQRTVRAPQDGPGAPVAVPAHLKPFDTAFAALDPAQQQWVLTNRPWSVHPNRFTVAQVAQAVEWMAANVPPATELAPAQG